MQLSNAPARIQVPFAISGLKRTIPIPSQIGVTPGAASFTDGFPPLTMTPLNAGGIPPAGQDFNGALNAITLIQQWQSAGGTFIYDATWSTANNGYPKGAVLLQAGGAGFWLCTTDNNTVNPDTGTPTGWAPLDSVGITAVTGLTNANVTLTPAQYGLSIITLAGTLTGNVQILFPAISGAQWVIANNTTGAFTVTVKTSAGTGVVVGTGQVVSVYGDGTNLLASAGSGRFIGRRVISSTQTYNATPGTTFVDAWVQAGGGGGGGAAGTSAGQISGGAGGGGGGWARKRITSGFSGVLATIGAAGTATLAAAGGAGGASSLGSLLSATGGAGGSLGPVNSAGPPLGLGSGPAGVGSLGDINGAGTAGLWALYYSTACVSGQGGSGAFGGGGAPASGSSSGTAASAPGAGGSGGCTVNVAGGAAGGVGAAGLIIIDEYA